MTDLTSTTQSGSALLGDWLGQVELRRNLIFQEMSVDLCPEMRKPGHVYFGTMVETTLRCRHLEKAAAAGCGTEIWRMCQRKRTKIVTI